MTSTIPQHYSDLVEIECEGIVINKPFEDAFLHKPLKEHIKQVKAMEIRDDDILICASMKCGMYVCMYTHHTFMKGSQTFKTVSKVAD